MHFFVFEVSVEPRAESVGQTGDDRVDPTCIKQVSRGSRKVACRVGSVKRVSNSRDSGRIKSKHLKLVAGRVGLGQVGSTREV